MKGGFTRRTQSSLEGTKTMPHTRSLWAGLVLAVMACGDGTEPPDPAAADRIKAEGADGARVSERPRTRAPELELGERHELPGQPRRLEAASPVQRRWKISRPRPPTGSPAPGRAVRPRTAFRSWFFAGHGDRLRGKGQHQV